jgi:hypothetical protein
MFWFRKTGIRPISPAGASLRALGEFFNDPQASDPLVNCGQVLKNTTSRTTKSRNTTPRNTAVMTLEAFTEEVRAVVEAEGSIFSYSHQAGKYSFYRLNLVDDEPVKLEKIRGRRSFVNLIFELDQNVGKAFLEITPHFTDGWRNQASQEFLKIKLPKIKQDAQYIRLINFNYLLGVPITSCTQIKEWVLNIEEQLEVMLSVDTSAPSGRWKYINNKLKDQWHLLSQLLPVQQ